MNYIGTGADFSADDLVDKTMYAGTNRVPLFRVAQDSATPFAYVNPGMLIGVVYSWVLPDPANDRQYVYLMYYDANNQVYFAQVRAGNYDLQKLADQGVETTDQKLEDTKLANLPWYEQLLVKYGKPILVTAVVAALASAAIKGYFSRPSNPK